MSGICGKIIPQNCCRKNVRVLKKKERVNPSPPDLKKKKFLACEIKFYEKKK